MRTRGAQPPFGDLATAGSDPLLWPLTDDWSGESQQFVQKLTRLGTRSKPATSEVVRCLEAWLDASALREPEPQLGIECLAWCHALPALTQTLPAAPWHQLLDQLVEIAEQSTALELTEGPLSHQLLAGELPISLALSFPEISVCGRLAEPGGRALSYGIVELLDGEGLLQAQNLQLSLPLLACWIRASYIDRLHPRRLLDDNAQAQLGWMMRQTLRLMRPDGSQALSVGEAGARQPGLIKAALDIVGDEDDRTIAAHMLSGAQLPAAELARLPQPAVSSEWAEVAIMRRNWQRKSEQLIVTYADQNFCSELNAGPETVWSGSCNPVVSVDGRKAVFQGEWIEVCALSDEDLDYVELEIELGGGRTLQRQLMLVREDRFLFMADAILGATPGQIDYESTLPLSTGTCFQPAGETHEGRLVGKRRLGTVLPLALPEWRTDRKVGQLEATADGLRHSMRSVGSRLFAPLFIDLDPRRLRNQLTWRQLTVAERLQIVADDVAVGYRVRVGRRQWLIYRSLSPPRNRTVLGQNFSTEFVIARFSAGSTCEKLVEIE